MLDIGGGIGALSFELLERGAERATIVDASQAYLDEAAGESKRRHRSEVTELVTGDFVGLSRQLPPAEMVTLDRVVCCYPDYEALLRAAAEHADARFAYSYLRDRWFVRLGVWLENAVRRLRRKSFRTFVHSPLQMEQILSQAGFRLTFRRGTLAWSGDVFVRAAAASVAGSVGRE